MCGLRAWTPGSGGHFQAVCPWGNHLTALCLSVPISNMESVRVTQGCCQPRGGREGQLHNKP